MIDFHQKLNKTSTVLLVILASHVKAYFNALWPFRTMNPLETLLGSRKTMLPQQILKQAHHDGGIGI